MSARLALATLLAVLALGGAEAAGAEPPTVFAIEGLAVKGGAETWRAEVDFPLIWTHAPSSLTPTWVGYEIRDSEGGVVSVDSVPWSGDHKELSVPPRPGVYTAGLRLGDGTSWGPEASIPLRFDNGRPATAEPLLPTGWLGAGERATLRIRHPEAPLPLSGIAGYAVSVGREAEAQPCEDPERCRPAEVDLGGGVDDDALLLGGLGEGIHHIAVLAVSGSGVSSEAAGSAVLRVDLTVPEVELTGVPSGWSSGPVRLRATATDSRSGMAAAGPAGPFTAIAVDGRLPTVAIGPSVEATVDGDGVHRVLYYGRDAAGNSGDGQLEAPPPRAASVRIDSSPPRVVFAAPDPADPELVEATVADALSGPASARGTIAVRRAGSTAAFEPLPTEVEPGRLSARWDSDSYPAGNYEFRATGYDRAGNATATERDAAGTRLLKPSPLKDPVALRFGFGGRRMVWHRCARRGARRRCEREVIEPFGRRPATRRMPYGRRVRVGGKLVGGGAPLAGRRVLLTESFADGSVRRRAVRTDRDGFFFARLSPGPSRLVEAAYEGERLWRRAAGRQLRLLVGASVRLRGSSATARVGGAPIVFRGRVGALAARIPPAGLYVELQFRLPGAEWSEFRTVRTDRRGRFGYSYAFSDDDSRGARFLFRAHVPEQEGWLYASASSRPIAVTGR